MRAFNRQPVNKFTEAANIYRCSWRLIITLHSVSWNPHVLSDGAHARLNIVHKNVMHSGTLPILQTDGAVRIFWNETAVSQWSRVSGYHSDACRLRCDVVSNGEEPATFRRIVGLRKDGSYWPNNTLRYTKSGTNSSPTAHCTLQPTISYYTDIRPSAVYRRRN